MSTQLKIRWISPQQPSDTESAEAKIREELAEMPVDPMEIVFHTVFLAGSDGPCISVTPSDDKTHLEAYYDETPEWYASEPLEEGPFAGMSVEYFAPKSKLHEGGE